MLKQKAMIERVRRVCREDGRLAAAMMYGSFVQGEGDEFSDIEFVLFFNDEDLGSVDQEEWVFRISPVELYFVNEYGNGTAIFDNLVRGEFHFDRASDVARIDEPWKDTDWLPTREDTLVLDCTGELARRLELVIGSPPDRDMPERAQFVCNCFVNWLLFGFNLQVRGELARALNPLGIVQDQLLYMVRMVEGSTQHWFNPAKLLEENVSPDAYARYAACTAGLDREDIRRAYISAWGWGREMMVVLSERHGLLVPATLLEKLDRRLTVALQGPRPEAQ